MTVLNTVVRQPVQDLHPVLVTRGGPVLDLVFVNGRSALDSRLTLARASGGGRFNALGAFEWLSASNSPRFEWDPSTLVERGLLLESQRTNSVRNPRCEGVVSGLLGSGGALPTDWSGYLGSGGMPQITVTAAAPVNGVPVVQISTQAFTPTGNSSLVIYFDGATQIAAASGQAWTESLFGSLTSGSLPGGATFAAVVEEHDSGGTYLTGHSSTLTFGATLQRSNYPVTLSNASCAYARPTLYLNYANGVAMPALTFQIGAPDLELGPMVSSLVLPPAGSPAAATRATDNLSMPLGSWFNPKAFTIVAEALWLTTPAGGWPTVVELHDGTMNNRVGVYSDYTSMRTLVEVGGVQTSPTAGTYSAGQVMKTGFSVAPGAQLSCLNGGVPATSAASLPPGLTTLSLGISADGSGRLNGYLRRLRVWPRAMAAGELQKATS